MAIIPAWSNKTARPNYFNYLNLKTGKTTKLLFEFGFQICIPNSSKSYSEPFWDVWTPLNTPFCCLTNDVICCSVHFVPGMQWSWFLGIWLLHWDWFILHAIHLFKNRPPPRGGKDDCHFYFYFMRPKVKNIGNNATGKLSCPDCFPKLSSLEQSNPVPSPSSTTWC